MLEELSQDPTLARFRMEYDKLHTALQRSHTNERRLMDKCRELQAEIAAHSAEVATALQLASEDKQTIEALKKVCVCSSDQPITYVTYVTILKAKQFITCPRSIILLGHSGRFVPQSVHTQPGFLRTVTYL